MPSNSARKKAIRALMAEHGISYAEANRQMSIPEPVVDAPCDYGVHTMQDFVPFAVDAKEHVVAWSMHNDPHMVLSGRPGCGKTVAAAAILHGALSAGIQISAATPKDDFQYLTDRFDTHIRMGHSDGDWATDYLAGVADMLNVAWREMQRRYELLAEHGVALIRDLPEADRLSRVLLFIDEYAWTTDPYWNTGPQEQHEQQVESRSMIQARVEQIAARGRAVGVHLLLTSQHDPQRDGRLNPIPASVLANCATLAFIDTYDPSTGRRQPGLALLTPMQSNPVKVRVMFTSAAQYTRLTPRLPEEMGRCEGGQT